MTIFKKLWQRLLVILGIARPPKKDIKKIQETPVNPPKKKTDLEKEQNPLWVSAYSPVKDEIKKQEKERLKEQVKDEGQAR